MALQTPKGTRDFLPEEMVKREFVINKIKEVFKLYGFDPLETPAFENLEVLEAKAGEDIKKQIYNFKDKSDRNLGLRFDLTVPMARVVASNPQLTKPFKRYAIAPVWRYEEVSAARKREFYQCDIDVCGSRSMEADVECIACCIDCLKSLGFKDFKIVINNRKVLDGFIELIKADRRRDVDIFRAIDKLQKFGEDAVKKELEQAGLNDSQIGKLLELISFEGDLEKVLNNTKRILNGIKIGEEGVNEMEDFIEFSKAYGIDKYLKLEISLARGLDYYTGPIFETIVKGYEKYGSIASGGRYDNLIELLGGRPTPATGISLGIERIIEIMKDEKMFDAEKTNVKIFVATVDEKTEKEAIKIVTLLRSNGINCQIDLMNRNLTKQLEYADNSGIPFVLIVGQKEVQKRKFKLRDMKKKSEKELNLKEVISELSVD